MSVLSATGIEPNTSDLEFRKVSSSSDIESIGVDVDRNRSREEKAARWFSRKAGNEYE